MARRYLSLSLLLCLSVSLNRVSYILAFSVVVRLPAPISRVPRYGELSFWPPRKPSPSPFLPSSPLVYHHLGKLYRCPLAELWQLFASCFYFRRRPSNAFRVSMVYSFIILIIVCVFLIVREAHLPQIFGNFI